MEDLMHDLQILEDRTPSLSLFLAHLTQLLPSLGVRRRRPSSVVVVTFFKNLLL
jgi:hypothetical protein